MRRASEMPDKKDVCLEKIITHMKLNGLPVYGYTLSWECRPFQNEILQDLNKPGYGYKASPHKISKYGFSEISDEDSKTHIDIERK